MLEISLCMIVKNEEAYLPNCLESVRDLVDEINIVDTGSTDATIEIAQGYTDRIFHFDWIDDFAAARNFSFSKATKDFIFWLDADDILTEENREKFKRLKGMLKDSTNYVMMDYACYDEDGEMTNIFPKIRIVRRSCGYQWKGTVHEYLDCPTNGFFTDLYVTHTKTDMNASNDRNMDMIKAVIDAGEGTPREFFYYGMMLYEMDREDEAIEPLSKVNDKSAFFDAMEAYLALHNIYRKKGDFIKARRVLEDNYSALKDKSEYYCYMGLFYKECLNDLEAAKRYYEHALNCKGTYRDIPSERNPEYYYYVPYYLLGQICVAQHKTHEAQDYYQKALSYRHSAHTVALVEKLKRYNQLENMI